MPSPAAELLIGLDARELLGRPTGVGRYLSELLKRWTRPNAAPAHRLLLYAPSDIRTDLAVKTRIVPGRGGTLWEQTRLAAAANADRVDVFFAPAYSGPLALKMPLVVTMHDVSFATHPEWFGWREGARRRLLAARAARRASILLTVSQFSAREIAAQFGVPPSRIRVIPNGITAPPRQADDGTERREPMVLFAGSVFTRRRVPDLVRAFGIVARRRADVRLVIAGENRTRPYENLAAIAGAEAIAERVQFEEFVSDARLGDLYRDARVFVFLSEYEGFGLTPLEALAAGVPIIVADAPYAHEMYGDAALFVPAEDLHATAEAIEVLLDDERVRARQLARGREVASRYSWDRAADATLAALEEAARGQPRTTTR